MRDMSLNFVGAAGWRSVGGLLALLVLSNGASGVPDAARVEVAQVFQPGLIALRDGSAMKPFRLAGIDPVARADRDWFVAAMTDVQRWTRDVSLDVVFMRPGKRDEASGFLALADGATLNERLLEQGYAVIGADGADFVDLAGRLRAAQIRARSARLRVWGAAPINPQLAEKALGQIATICGEVGFVTDEHDGSRLLHLGNRYPRRDVSLRVLRPAAAEAELGFTTFLHKEICATGRVIKADRSLEIVVADATQFRAR